MLWWRRIDFDQMRDCVKKEINLVKFGKLLFFAMIPLKFYKIAVMPFLVWKKAQQLLPIEHEV